MKLFIILGNQLFNPKYLSDYKDHTFFMAEDYGLCTFEKHHKLKILLFLSSMRSFKDELKSKNFNLIYKDVNKDFKLSYEKKLEKTIKEKKIREITFFEIEDKFFEKRILNLGKKNSLKINQVRSPMFLMERQEFKDYLSKNKRPFMANFYKIVRTKMNLLMNKNGTPKGNKWSFDEDNRKKLPNNIKVPVISKTKETKETIVLKEPVVEIPANGQATVDVIQSCVPNIRNAWMMPSIDLDSVLTAIRIATYGEKMEITTICPKCKEEQNYDYELGEHLERISNFAYPEQLQIGDLVFGLKPYNYKEITNKQIQQIEQERIFEIINNEKLSEEEKLERFGASFIKLTEMTVSVVVQSIVSITSPQGTVTDKQMISDFVQNADKEIFTTLNEHLQGVAKQLEIKAKRVKCGDCEHEFDVQMTMDQANFFGVKS